MDLSAFLGQPISDALESVKMLTDIFECSKIEGDEFEFSHFLLLVNSHFYLLKLLIECPKIKNKLIEDIKCTS